MRQKALFLGLLLTSVWLTSAQTSHAQIIILGGPNAEEIRNLYAGSVVVEDNGYNQDYWYVDPDEKVRYYLSDGISVSRLLRKQGEGIGNKVLAKIPQNRDQQNADYDLVHKYRGHILLQVETDGSAWYINPLDDLRYHIENGKAGLETLQDLAIQISSPRLNAIPEATDTSLTKKTRDAIDFDMFWQVQNTLKNYYYQPDKITDLDMFYGSLKGLANSLDDPYTEFFTPRNKQDFQNRLEGSVEGIGAYVDIKDGRFIIISPLENSPAKAAGLLPNDQVLLVDGRDIKGWLLEDAIAIIRGPSGTKVTLKIYRSSTDRTFEVTIVRAKVETPNIESKTIDGDISYIKVNIFSQDLPQEFASAVNQTINDKTRGVIVDLRNNPGGYTSSALNLAEYWLSPNQLIVRENYKNHSQNFNASAEPKIKLPTVILVNSGTASASEIFTLALSKNNLAQTVGETSFGKGTGQSLVNFEDGSALKYTIFEWFGPQDTSVEGKGITPDFVVEYNPNVDMQLQKAKTLFR